MSTPHLAIGVDFGTSACRALLADTDTGAELHTAVAEYPTGRDGVILDPADPHLARQHPGDYIAAFERTVAEVVRAAGSDAERIVGIGIDATGSTPIPIDAEGTPLGMLERYQNNPHAQAWLWKDHTAHAEAAEITELARRRGEPYLDACGGTYSSEWFWSKILRCKRVAPDVFADAFSWVEQSDFIPAWITGNRESSRIERGICAAGHKAMFSEQWGGLPSESFLAELDPDLAELRKYLYANAEPGDRQAGTLLADIAQRVGLPSGIPVAVGVIDAHAGAVASGVEPGTLVKIIGTSTCDITVIPTAGGFPDLPGVCGVVPGSVLPDAFGVEAGQSAVGDLLNWCATNLGPSAGTDEAHQTLTSQASRLRPGESGLLALDWNNGNRTVLVDPLLSGLVIGQTLHTTPAEIYRALIEATAFGARRIIEQIESTGPAIERVVNCGGIAEKNPLFMQIYADVIGRPMQLSRSTETCALGAAIFGSVVGGAHPSVAHAQAAMTGIKDLAYVPQSHAVDVYNQLYDLYLQLHDSFGGVRDVPGLGGLMKRLIEIRRRVAGTLEG